MSYFEDQEDAWLENDCKGSPSDYDPFDADSWPGKHSGPDPNDDETALLKKLEAAANGKGLKCSCHGNGHFQVRAGRKIINWYPYSKRQTVYDAATGEKRFGLSVQKVIEFALEKEKVQA
jgi:hypothetical protein